MRNPGAYVTWEVVKSHFIWLKITRNALLPKPFSSRFEYNIYQTKITQERYVTPRTHCKPSFFQLIQLLRSLIHVLWVVSLFLVSLSPGFCGDHQRVICQSSIKNSSNNPHDSISFVCKFDNYSVEGQCVHIVESFFPGEYRQFGPKLTVVSTCCVISSICQFTWCRWCMEKLEAQLARPEYEISLIHTSWSSVIVLVTLYSLRVDIWERVLGLFVWFWGPISTTKLWMIRKKRSKCYKGFLTKLKLMKLRLRFCPGNSPADQQRTVPIRDNVLLWSSLQTVPVAVGMTESKRVREYVLSSY